MASVALRAFASIASRAPQIFRSLWSTIKASPTLTSIKDAVIGEVIGKGIQMLDEKTSTAAQPIRNVWDVARTGILANSMVKMLPKKTLTYRIKKVWLLEASNDHLCFIFWTYPTDLDRIASCFEDFILSFLDKNLYMLAPYYFGVFLIGWEPSRTKICYHFLPINLIFIIKPQMLQTV